VKRDSEEKKENAPRKKEKLKRDSEEKKENAPRTREKPKRDSEEKKENAPRKKEKRKRDSEAKDEENTPRKKEKTKADSEEKDEEDDAPRKKENAKKEGSSKKALIENVPSPTKVKVSFEMNVNGKPRRSPRQLLTEQWNMAKLRELSLECFNLRDEAMQNLTFTINEDYIRGDLDLEAVSLVKDLVIKINE